MLGRYTRIGQVCNNCDVMLCWYWYWYCSN